MKNIYKIFGLILLFISFLVALACQKSNVANNQSPVNSASNTATAPQMDFAEQRANTPTEAFKLLFGYVKAKNTQGIKSMMTKDTVAFAQFQAESRNVPLEKVLENGFTATTFSDALPEIRDERIKENMGAVEVKNVKENKWEDLAFMLEDGGWKLAIGEIFKGSYQKPAVGQSFKEQEAANISSGNNMKPLLPNNANIPLTKVPQPPAAK
jgi:hypothetical protein